MKKGFFEMEMADIRMINEFRNELETAGCKFVEACGGNIHTDQCPIYENCSFYGEVPGECEGYMAEESAHGYDYLKEEYNRKYGNQTKAGL